MARERKQLLSRTKIKLQQIVRLEVLEKSPAEIAAACGITESTLSELIKHPEYGVVRDKYMEKLYGPIDGVIKERKANVILDDTAADAADVLADLIYSNDEVTARISATAVLDRTGHGPIQRKAVRTRHELDPVAISMLKTALLEASKAKVKVIDAEPADSAD